MRVLIIGAGGAVGSRLTRQLRQQGHDVTGTYRSASRESSIRSGGATPLVLDVAGVRPDAIAFRATAPAGMRFGPPGQDVRPH